jgi:hypothetical protein
VWKWIVLLLVVVAVVAYLTRARRGGRAEVTAEQLEELDLRLSHEARVAIGAAIARGRKVLAIKLYRENTGADLATSKAAIDKWYKGIHG